MIISTEEILKYFPSFEKGLAEGITRHEEIRTFRENEFLMQTGQYIRSTMLGIRRPDNLSITNAAFFISLTGINSK